MVQSPQNIQLFQPAGFSLLLSRIFWTLGDMAWLSWPLAAGRATSGDQL